MDLSAGASFLERLTFSGKVTALGMGTVFGVLIIIWIILVPFKYIFGDKKKKPAPIVEKAPPAPAKVETVSIANDTEIVAAIMASIAASEGKTIKIVSIKPRKSSAWSEQ